MSNTTIIIIVVIVVLIVIVSLTIGVAIPLRSLRKNKKKADILKATGQKGDAKVLQLVDTGVRINDNPRVNLLLEVHIPGYPSYQVQKTVSIPKIRASQVQVGAVVPVLADPTQPDNPDKVGILLH